MVGTISVKRQVVIGTLAVAGALALGTAGADASAAGSRGSDVKNGDAYLRALRRALGRAAGRN